MKIYMVKLSGSKWWLFKLGLFLINLTLAITFEELNSLYVRINKQTLNLKYSSIYCQFKNGSPKLFFQLQPRSWSKNCSLLY